MTLFIITVQKISARSTRKLSYCKQFVHQ